MAQDEVLTRQKILDTAMGLFMQKGFENTSVQNIIDSVGIAKGTFYHHFKSKDDVLVEQVDRMTSMIFGPCEEILARPDLDARQKFVMIFTVAGGIKLKELGKSLPLLRQLKTGANQRLERQMQDALKRFTRPIFARLIRMGVEEGQFSVRSPEATAELVVALGMGMRDESLDLMIKALEGSREALQECVALFNSLNDAIERILGVEAGTIPLYDTTLLEEGIANAANN